MNYVILNDREYFEDKICFKRLKEVSLNGRARCDGVFGTISTEILEEISRDSDARDRIFEKGGLYGDWGLEFIVFKIPKDILHTASRELITSSFGLVDEDRYCTQLWSYCYKNTWEYFIIGLNKNQGFNYIFETKIDADNDDWGIKKICERIEEILYDL